MKDHFEEASGSHEISEREKQAWQSGKNSKRAARPELNTKQKERFLKLIAELASPILFERELGLSQADVEFYKNEFSIETQDDARRALRRLVTDTDEVIQARVRDNIQQQRAAEAVAQERLDEFEQKKAADAASKRATSRAAINPDATRQEDAERQKKFVESQEILAASKSAMSDWRLELDGRASFDEERISAFRHDIIERGFNFCMQKYGASSRELKAEATRLNLKIDWNLIRR
jgi:hypothetical protein